jgi:two-component system sensor histidine kinase ChiS
MLPPRDPQLGHEVFSHILPFHLIWSAGGTLESVSASVRRLWGLREDEMPVIRLERPFSAKLNAAWFGELTGMVLTLSCQSAPSRPLRGEIVVLPDGRWLLCALPPMGRVADLEHAGLKLSDLPLHSGLGDALIAAEAAHVSLEESQAALHRLEKVNRSLSEVNAAFGRFVPRQFLEALGIKSPLDATLGARATTQTAVLFADLRNFTSISERMETRDIFAFINRYLENVAPCIRKNDGFVVHYLGDGILALFQGHPGNALQAATEMQAAVRKEIARDLIGSGLPADFQFTLGIGLHFGRIEMGIVGESGRWDCSVISDTVNTAYRVEGLTKTFGAEVLFTGQFEERLPENASFKYRRLGRMRIKGRAEKVNIFESLDALPPSVGALRISSAQTFSEALAAFETGDMPAAAVGFQQCLATDPSDVAAQHYLDRCAVDPESI